MQLSRRGVKEEGGEKWSGGVFSSPECWGGGVIEKGGSEGKGLSARGGGLEGCVKRADTTISRAAGAKWGGVASGGGEVKGRIEIGCCAVNGGEYGRVTKGKEGWLVGGGNRRMGTADCE